MTGFRAPILLAALLLCPAVWAQDVSREALARRMASHAAPLLLDVRTPKEYGEGHLAGALNIPVEDVAARHGVLDVPHDREVVVYCKSGKRAARARDTLRALGYTNVRLLEGSADAWRAEARPLVQEHPSP